MPLISAGVGIEAAQADALGWLEFAAPGTGMRSNLVNQLLTSIADAGWDLLRRRQTGRRSKPETLCVDLLSTRGDAVGAALARQLVDRCMAMARDERLAFFSFLARTFEPDPAGVAKAAEAYAAAPSPASLQVLRKATESRRIELFRRMNMAPGGIRALVGLRQTLLGLLEEAPALAGVEADLHELLTGWFNPGFLSLVRIDWNSPASLLEKLIRYEKVHKIPNLEALRRRLGADRRCFAFFHPALADEPLIFVQVALVEGMASRIEPLIDPGGEPGDAGAADTAIFYSISNCQDGLRGVSLGNFLIKLVVDELQRDLPGIRRFATLSPVPGFKRWLEEAAGTGALDEADRALVARLDDPSWSEDTSFRAAAGPRLTALCAHYLVVKKRGSRPRDPVARFHLNNGARLERINWDGDASAKGLIESAGILVNYRYNPERIGANHEAYANDGTVVASPAVRALLPSLPDQAG